MTTLLLASMEVIHLLERLFKLWGNWEENRSFYINTLLPNLMKFPNKGELEERKIIKEIKKIASAQELENLVKIADNLYTQKKLFDKASRNLDIFFHHCDLDSAKEYADSLANPEITTLFENKREAYVIKNFNLVEENLHKFNFSEAEIKYSSIETLLSNNQKQKYKDFLRSNQRELKKITIAKIKKACNVYDFHTAEKLFLEISSFTERGEIDHLIADAENKAKKESRLRFVEETKGLIRRHLNNYKFGLAIQKYQLIQEEFPKEEFEKELNQYKFEYDKRKFLNLIKSYLDSYHFQESDQLFFESNYLDEQSYVKLKSDSIIKFVKNKYKIELNEEQAIALSQTSQNLLISARAGSGKTRVLACKTNLLIDTENIHPDHILVMAFNRKAKQQIRDRINYLTPFNNAKTFHALARSLVQPTEKFIYDENDDDDISGKELTLFIQKILKKKLSNPLFVDDLYSFFRKEMKEIESSGYFLNETDYLNYRKNLFHVTLNGDRVKSQAEKYIADYLFEHNIKFEYEKARFWDNKIYRPDFTIYFDEKEYVIEHWGIDEFDPRKETPREWNISWDEYRKSMCRKRDFLKYKKVVLIETSKHDIQNGRDNFELVLEKKLKDVGINNPKLPETEIKKKLKNQDYIISQFANLFTQFIQRAKKKPYTSKDIEIKLENYIPRDEKEKLFVKVGIDLFINFEEELQKIYKITFDDLLVQAINKINVSKGDCTFPLENRKNGFVHLRDIKWILIDEFQDFSNLFYDLIKAISKYNPDVRIVCVGDDWQAINGFAGSDTKFFTRFHEFIPFSKKSYLKTNFRSQSEIVKISNDLMYGKGTPSEYLCNHIGGKIFIEWIDDVWLEMRKKSDGELINDEDQKFFITSNKLKNNAIGSKYLKRCFQIIVDNSIRHKSFAILSRTNKIENVSLRKFEKQLMNILMLHNENFVNQEITINISTVHKFKGREADCVIILDVVNGSFPLIHPDNSLFRIFGINESDIYIEELNLFYVAITRAKESLYLLTEKDNESVFLNNMAAYKKALAER